MGKEKVITFTNSSKEKGKNKNVKKEGNDILASLNEFKSEYTKGVESVLENITILLTKQTEINQNCSDLQNLDFTFNKEEIFRCVQTVVSSYFEDSFIADIFQAASAIGKNGETYDITIQQNGYRFVIATFKHKNGDTWLLCRKNSKIAWEKITPNLSASCQEILKKGDAESLFLQMIIDVETGEQLDDGLSDGTVILDESHLKTELMKHRGLICLTQEADDQLGLTCYQGEYFATPSDENNIGLAFKQNKSYTDLVDLCILVFEDELENIIRFYGSDIDVYNWTTKIMEQPEEENRSLFCISAEGLSVEEAMTIVEKYINRNSNCLPLFTFPISKEMIVQKREGIMDRNAWNILYSKATTQDEKDRVERLKNLFCV